MSTKITDIAVNSDGKSQPAPEAFRVIDKRHFLELDKLPAGAPDEEKPRYPTFVEELLGRVAETEKRFEERKAQMQEEISRIRMRLDGEFQRNIEMERQKIVLPFLEILDNLERALAAGAEAGNYESLRQGVEMIAGLFRAKLRAQGVEPVEVLNQPFDPNHAQAVGMVALSDPAQDGVVVDELARGYRMGEQLIRPAQVRVGHLKR